ncbi:DUF4870 domain-containing protein [Aggregicoccus sp. 17bor-14]|nr:DUF4870 domain-containing protein [Aggregicoccus sp. 17bor-14]
MGTYLSGTPAPTQDEKTWGLLSHLSGILLGFLGPLIAMLVKGKESAWINTQAKEALNFEITALLAYTVIGAITCGFGLLLLWPLVTVFHIIAAMKANNGETYRYPATLRLVK